ncbi:MAG: transketolase [Lentisphaerae bacterium]|nr:transketolase [Lentisphaerota bacterium]
MASKLDHGDLTLVANTIRGLAMDGVQKAKSGHPGMPMGMADIAAVLWLSHLNHCPSDPAWPDRDRFVLSNGHGSMLLYSLLHLSGYDLPVSELQAFRQWESRTPGHPERHVTPGVETTTGPLGQGIANAVGMALAERMLAARFNDAQFAPVDHYTYVFCGDGCLMEGISHEACSLAGHLKLNRLVLIYDDNSITIEGATSLACSDDAARRFQAYGWNVLRADAHDFDAIERALRKARRSKDKPTFVIARSHIGKGSPNKVDTASVHGEPLGDDEVRASKRNLGLPEDQAFHVPDRVRELFSARAKKLERLASSWRRRMKAMAKASPEKAALWRQYMDDAIPVDLDARLPKFDPATPVATRSASAKVIQSVAAAIPQLVGGSADLAPSTRTLIDGAASVAPGRYDGRNFHFGIREHAMCAVMNGIALHGGLRVFGSTFFVFADYCRPALRLAAVMELPVIYVFTHDSFYVGEDGPTHEPVEHIASLRCMPGMTVIRPSDPTETGAAWAAALRHKKGPVALLLSRQNIPVIDRTANPAAANLEKGAYTLFQTAEGDPDLIIIASGSEVQLAIDSARALAAQARVRVVSMPSWEMFDRQPKEYRESVLPKACAKRIAIEAGVPFGWERYVGRCGKVVALNRFGASAPYKTLAEKFGFTTANVVATAKGLLA